MCPSSGLAVSLGLSCPRAGSFIHLWERHGLYSSLCAEKTWSSGSTMLGERWTSVRARCRVQALGSAPATWAHASPPHTHTAAFIRWGLLGGGLRALQNQTHPRELWGTGAPLRQASFVGGFWRRMLPGTLTGDRPAQDSATCPPRLANSSEGPFWLGAESPKREVGKHRGQPIPGPEGSPTKVQAAG